MTEKEYYKQLYEVIDDGFHDYRKYANEHDRISNKIKCDMYTAAVQREKVVELNDLKNKMSRIQNEVVQACNKLTDEIINEVSAADVLNPADMNDDIKLLNAGVGLNEKDITDLLQRNEGNRTMTQLILRYAAEHNLRANAVYTPAAKTAELLNDMRYVSETVVKWFESPEQYHAILQTAFDGKLDDDSDDE